MLRIFIVMCANLLNTNDYLFQLVIKEVLFLFISFTVIFGVLLFLMFLGQDGLCHSLTIVLVTWLFLLKHKSDFSIVLPKFCYMIKNQFGVNVKRFRSDNAKDYFNQVLTPYFQKEGIVHESSCINTPQENGVVERKNDHLLEST